MRYFKRLRIHWSRLVTRALRKVYGELYYTRGGLMFEVHAYSRVGDHWKAKDREMDNAVGVPANHGEIEGPTKQRKYSLRHRVWLVDTFDEARAFKELLNRVDGVNSTIREH